MAAAITPGAGWSGATDTPAAVGSSGDPGYDGTCVARWAHVHPDRDFGTTLEVEVVAFHVNGIAKVSFAVDGGSWVDVTTPVADAHGCYTYRAELDATDFASDGPVEVRAIVYPAVAGQCRVLQGDRDATTIPTGMFSARPYRNISGTYSSAIYVDAATGDDTTGDGTSGTPYATLSRAVTHFQGLGDQEMVAIYLAAGNYTETAGGSNVSIDSWLTVTLWPGLGLSVGDVVINASSGSGLRCNKVHYKSIRFEAVHTQGPSGTPTLWLDGCENDNADATLDTQVASIATWVGGIFAQGVTYSNLLRAMVGYAFARDIVIDTIAGDCMVSPRGAMNVEVSNLVKIGETHTDFVQISPPDGGRVENCILYRMVARDNCESQLLFVRADAGSAHTGILKDCAFVDWYGYEDPNAHQVQVEMEHVLFWRMALIGSSAQLVVRNDSSGSGPACDKTDVSIRGCLFQSYTDTQTGDEDNVIIDGNHFVSGTPVGTDYDTGTTWSIYNTADDGDSEAMEEAWFAEDPFWLTMNQLVVTIDGQRVLDGGTLEGLSGDRTIRLAASGGNVTVSDVTLSGGVTGTVTGLETTITDGAYVEASIHIATPGTVSIACNVGDEQFDFTIDAEEPTAMGVMTKVGTLNITTGAASSTVAVSGLGFTPKVLILWWSGLTATSNGDRATSLRGMGWAVSASSFCAHTNYDEDAAGTSVAFMRFSSTGCVTQIDNTGAEVGRADLQSFDADGFTLEIQDAFPTDLLVSYLAIGGSDITNAEIGTFTSTGTAPVNQVVNNSGNFQPDVTFFMSARTDSDSIQMFGAATGAGTEQVICTGENHVTASGAAGAYCLADECIAFASSNPAGSPNIRGEFVSHNTGPGGFTVNWLENGAGRAFAYLSIKGGLWKVGNLLTQTDTSTAITATSFGFTPAALMVVSAGNAANTQDGTPTTHDKWSVGAATSSSSRVVQQVDSRSGNADMFVHRSARTDAVYVNTDPAQTSHTVTGLMDVQSLDPDGFSLIMDDADPSQAFAWYAAVGQIIPGSLAVTIDGDSVAEDGTVQLAAGNHTIRVTASGGNVTVSGVTLGGGAGGTLTGLIDTITSGDYREATLEVSGDGTVIILSDAGDGSYGFDVDLASAGAVSALGDGGGWGKIIGQ